MSSNGTKGFWKNVRKFGPAARSPKLPDIKLRNGKFASGSKAKADALSEEFRLNFNFQEDDNDHDFLSHHFNSIWYANKEEIVKYLNQLRNNAVIGLGRCYFCRFIEPINFSEIGKKPKSLGI